MSVDLSNPGGIKELPILFKGAMVRAILEGKKTQTRRIIDPKRVLSAAERRAGFEFSMEHATAGNLGWIPALGGNVEGVKELAKWEQLNVPVRHPDDRCMAFEDCGRNRIYCPYGEPGNRLWVKETWKRIWTDGSGTAYRADYVIGSPEETHSHWKPSIFMTRARSRILLEITKVRVERVQEITRKDAIAEGVDWKSCPSFQTPGQLEAMIHGRGLAMTVDYVGGYWRLWDTLNAKRGFGWDKNPWVWVIEFRRIEV